MLDIRASPFFDTPHMRLVEFVGGCLSLLVHSPWPRFHIYNFIFLSISIIFFHSIEEHVDNHDTDHGTPWRIALQGDPANDWLKSQVTKEPRARAQNEKEHLHYCHHMISLQQYIANDSKDGVLCNYYVQNIPTSGVYCNRRIKYALLFMWSFVSLWKFDIGICTFKGPKAKKALYFWCMNKEACLQWSNLIECWKLYSC
jgi:hypothetical protein